MKSTLFEVIAYNSILTANDQSAVEQYLADKYQISNNGCGNINLSSTGQPGPGGIGKTDGKTSLQLWLRADSGLALPGGGGVFNKWLDQSGAGNDVSSSSGPVMIANAQNGLPGLKFNGSSFLQSQVSASFYPSKATVFLVRKSALQGADMAICGENTKFNNEFLMMNNIGYMHRSSGNFVTRSHQCESKIPDDSVQIFCVKYGENGTSVDIYVNGLKSTQNSQTTGSSLTYGDVNKLITIGQRNSFSSSEYLKGMLFEVVGYNRVLSDSERDSVETYLGKKYNVALNGCDHFGAIDDIKNGDFSIHPNPSNGKVLIKGSSTHHISTNAMVQVYDATGKLAFSTSVNSGDIVTEIDLTHLESGTYMIQLSNGSFQHSRLMIIQR